MEHENTNAPDELKIAFVRAGLDDEPRKHKWTGWDKKLSFGPGMGILARVDL